jgi:hypothetical protein
LGLNPEDVTAAIYWIICSSINGYFKLILVQMWAWN